MSEIKHAKNWHKVHVENRPFGARVADSLALLMGSWGFIIAQSVFITCWVALNLLATIYHWDPYPFILLNLLFSVQAAYAAPIIMMAQNRQSDRDRAQAEADYQTNLEAKEEIETLQIVLARIEKEKLDQVLSSLAEIKSKIH